MNTEIFDTDAFSYGEKVTKYSKFEYIPISTQVREETVYKV